MHPTHELTVWLEVNLIYPQRLEELQRRSHIIMANRYNAVRSSYYTDRRYSENRIRYNTQESLWPPTRLSHF